MGKKLKAGTKGKVGAKASNKGIGYEYKKKVRSEKNGKKEKS